MLPPKRNPYESQAEDYTGRYRRSYADPFISFTFAYYMFIRVTTKGEADLLKEKAKTLLLKDLPNHPEYWRDNSQMEELLIPQEMLRYIGPDSKVIYQIFSDETLIRYPVTYVNKDTITVETASDGIYVFVKMPVLKKAIRLPLSKSAAACVGWVIMRTCLSLSSS